MARLLRSIAGSALALLQVLHGFAQRVEGAFFRLQLDRLLLELLLDIRDLARYRCGEARLLALETLPSLRELILRALVILASRLDDADRLLALRDPLLQLRGDGRGFLHRFVQRR